MRKVLVIVALASLGWSIGWSSSIPASAHNSGRQQGHGDCTSDAAAGEYDWRLHGTAGDDSCNGHDAGPDNRDFVTTNGGQDQIQGEGGSDRLEGDDEADNLFGGDGGTEANRELVLGESGGGDQCSDPDPGRCERIRGGDGVDSVFDNAGVNTGSPADYDRACDGSGEDFVDVADGDNRDIVHCLCDRAGDVVFFDDEPVRIRNCGF